MEKHARTLTSALCEVERALTDIVRTTWEVLDAFATMVLSRRQMAPHVKMRTNAALETAVVSRSARILPGLSSAVAKTDLRCFRTKDLAATSTNASKTPTSAGEANAPTSQVDTRVRARADFACPQMGNGARTSTSVRTLEAETSALTDNAKTPMDPLNASATKDSGMTLLPVFLGAQTWMNVQLDRTIATKMLFAQTQKVVSLASVCVVSAATA